ncbi:helix-turn-helix domain-containing protein [Schleiferilactobacillus shenzhenensis]|uniref:helix-turn-helix domain-containing protein n=1 Tax=Schleiferilactobacillus shenzhenensis TaxID=1231337 RepID=UPI000423E205|nr:Rgg/GadR/MutR family transcriptional regulator [Schleiferilactobacillus shenzhenensis]
MKFGEKIREIRESKQIKMEDITDDVISQPFLSRFERGQSDISLGRFNHLLQQLHVTPTEFFSLMQDNPDTTAADYEYFGQLPDFFLSPEIVQNKTLLAKKLAQAKELVATAHTAYIKKPNRWNLISWRGAESLQNHIYMHLDPSKIVALNVTPIQSYLLNLDAWTAVDIVIFAFFSEYMSANIKMQLLQLIVKHIPKSSILGSWDNFLLEIVLSSFEQFIIAKQLSYAQNTIDIMQTLSAHFGNTDYEIILLFVTGWFQYVQGKKVKPDAVRKMDDAISIMAILHHDDDAKQFRDLKDKITGDNGDTITSDVWL